MPRCYSAKCCNTSIFIFSVNPQMEKHEIALLMLLGFCGFSILVAVGYKKLRKYIFHDEHNLDTVFDAGGRVSLSLTAVTVTSQLLWPSDFALVSSISSGVQYFIFFWTVFNVEE